MTNQLVKNIKRIFYVLCYLFIAILFFHSFPAWAHGVRGRTGKGGISISAEYTTGDPMSYARVKIAAPDSKLPFQSGRTDRNGRFCFFPDTQGTWKVVVNDEMGHQLELNVIINKQMEIKPINQNVGQFVYKLPEYERAFMGVSIIFCVAGILFWWRGCKVRNT